MTVRHERASLNTTQCGTASGNTVLTRRVSHVSRRNGLMAHFSLIHRQRITGTHFGVSDRCILTPTAT